MALFTASTQAMKLKDPLSREEEARAIENAILDRTVASLDTETAHPKDSDHSGAISALRGRYHTNEDAINKMGPLKDHDPILGKVVERI